MTVYSIRDWDSFECAQSRKVTGPLAWVAMPTKHDGKVYRKIMTRTDGLMIFAAWVLMVEVAAKCPIRGRLADADGPLAAADLELKTGCPATAFETALKLLSSKDFGWIDADEWERPTTTGQDRTRDNSASAELSSAEFRRDGGDTAATEFSFPCVGKGPKEWTLSKVKLDEYIASYPGLDVLAELRKARQWCRDRARQRKTAGGMSAFLTGWLNRAQNRGVGKNGVASDVAYLQVSAEIFRGHWKAKRFKDGPTRHVTDKRWVYGTLRDGTKVECKDYQ